MQPCNLLTQPLCRNVSDFCCIVFGGICRRIFLGISNRKEEEKIRRQNPRKKSGAPPPPPKKIVKSVLPKPDPRILAYCSGLVIRREDLIYLLHILLPLWKEQSTILARFGKGFWGSFRRPLCFTADLLRISVMAIPTKENLVGGKAAPTAIS